MVRSSKGYAQGCQQNLWTMSWRGVLDLQTSILCGFKNLVVGIPASVVYTIWTPQFCGENRSQTISEGALLKLTAADNDRALQEASVRRESSTPRRKEAACTSATASAALKLVTSPTFWRRSSA
ncbi:hypothetical protein PUN4_120111 [Paraburkholderia unamae]|nr:hypothetical protein PUN4_120111 [Paraburkholderia unamae]